MARLNLAREAIKRKNRAVALQNATAIILPQQRIDDRIAMFKQRALEHAINPENRVRPLYCFKTGAYITKINGEVASFLSQFCSASDIHLFDNRHCHPAWLNTSADRLRELQIEMPHHYCVYTFNLLLRSERNVEERKEQLAAIEDWAIAHVVEFAELLRRALGMFGRHEQAAKNITFNPALHEASFCISDLRDWITAWIQVTQRKHHAQSADRQRVVTLGDIKNFTLDLGMPLFRASRIASHEDNVMLADVAEIFETDTRTGITAAYSYHPKPQPKEPQFTGRSFGNVAGFAVSANGGIPKASLANATVKVKLFGETK